MTNDYRAMCSGYEPGDGSMDGAQLVDGEWWHPMFGCDSLQMVVDRAHALLQQQAAPAPVVAPVPVSEVMSIAAMTAALIWPWGFAPIS